MDKVGNYLEKYFSQKIIMEGNQYYNLFNKWEEICNTDIASHSRITEISNGNLIVEVDHPGWLQILKTKERQILKRIQTEFPELEISRISLFVNQTNKAREKSQKRVKKAQEEKDFTEIESLLNRFRKQISDHEKKGES